MTRQCMADLNAGIVWRKTPPGVDPSENILIRSDTNPIDTPRRPDKATGAPAIVAPDPTPQVTPTPGSMR